MESTTPPQLTMTDNDWETFDKELQNNLIKGDHEVEVSIRDMQKYDNVSTTAEVVIKKEKRREKTSIMVVRCQNGPSV